ncbi:hypothetical protein D5018_04315 [Parashewanella curva]|uniref:Uncharacterized protein n=1 Tax=Parashewanella curva TaxID=2338552 RepID=A0A3L8Q296_9GAMM|nr:hypothetical protein [Parashewanella curva]RLV60873.1 hypothetical protein D5018_04315 [Parashewanella curva]
MFELVDLENVRNEMISEIQNDIAQDKLYISDRLNQSGKEVYSQLLLAAAEEGNIESFVANLNMGYFNPTYLRKKPSGGFTSASMPYNANATLCEGEFNRFYIRAVCQKAISQDQQYITVYRARHSGTPRSASLRLENQQFSALQLLNDLQANVGVDTALGLPPGPNSGMSVKL